MLTTSKVCAKGVISNYRKVSDPLAASSQEQPTEFSPKQPNESDQASTDHSDTANPDTKKKTYKSKILLALGVVVVVGLFVKFGIPAFSHNASNVSLALSDVSKGDTVRFGHFEQDNVKSNGTEQLEWVVIDQKDDACLLLSKSALFCQPFHTSYEDVTWENSSIRNWLNDDFYSSAFGDDEKKSIVKTTLETDSDTDYECKTDDYVFLLSTQEAEEYLCDTDYGKAFPTEYALRKGAYVNTSTNSSWWWLRSHGTTECRAAGFYGKANIDTSGDKVNSKKNVVRPAIWVSLESD